MPGLHGGRPLALPPALETGPEELASPNNLFGWLRVRGL